MALLLAQLLLLALTLASAAPVTLYVSSSSGSDAAPGTAPATPFATLQRAAAAAAALGPDGACAGILLLRGDAWTLSSAWALSGLRGASAAQPLVLGSYGAAAARRPRLLRQAPAAGPTLLLDNCSAVALQGLEVVGGENGVAFVFDVAAQVPTVYEGFAVTDCFFNQIGGLAYNASSGSWWGAAIAFAARHAGVQVRGVTIAGNLVNGSDVFYGNSVPYSGFTRAYVSHLNISSNAITHCGYNVLFLDSTSFVLVEGNAFLHDTPPRLFVAGTTDIIMGTLNASVALRGNEFSQRGEYPGGPDGCAIDFETNATGVTFSGNFISRSFGAGVMVFGHVDGSNTALQLTNNTILHSGCGQTRGDHGGIAFMRKGSSGLLAGNVLASCPGVPALNDALDPGLPGWQQAGNVIDGQGGAAVAACAAPVVSAAPAAGGGLRIDAALGGGASALPCRLTYSLTGAPPGPDAPAFPAGGLALPPQWRALAVLVKAWPSAAAAAPGVTSVPSESAGGVFAP